MRLPLAIGAVVVGVVVTFHTPLSGQLSPVRAVVPIGFFILISSYGQLLTKRSGAVKEETVRSVF
jgi:hypothetical protein